MPQTVTLVLYDPAHAADLDYRLHGESKHNTRFRPKSGCKTAGSPRPTVWP